ncbi:MAG: tRNA (guanosine(46)-N7)-methyltransferase TrmB [Gammaproteobacteria bacterium]|nr:tRNA (guanosine(46)-N7)-methyltransferase TrmB [Gammaproteobacteria bacterium]
MRQLYVRRGSRMTDAQAKAYSLLDDYRIDPHDLDIHPGFIKNESDLLVEIGFGNGEVLAEFAASNPTWNCIGVEVFRPGIGALIRRCQQGNLVNIRIAETDGLTLLEALPDSSVSLVFVFFPDPWPKTRHHRRRLVTEEFVDLTSHKLKVGGLVCLATDWEHYAQQMDTVFKNHSILEGGPSERYELRPKTRFEHRGEKLGHGIWDFQYRRVKSQHTGTQST